MMIVLVKNVLTIVMIMGSVIIRNMNVYVTLVSLVKIVLFLNVLMTVSNMEFVRKEHVIVIMDSKVLIVHI